MRRSYNIFEIVRLVVGNIYIITKLVGKRYTIFYDMDNCVAQWCLYGKDEEVLAAGKQLEEGYFRSLPLVNGSPEVLRVLTLLGLNVCILSACEDTPFCRQEKRDWIKENLPFIKQENIFLVSKGECKTKHIVPGAVLVDDYGPNLRQWANAGGIAIKKVNSGRVKTLPHIINHSEIFSVLHDLFL